MESGVEVAASMGIIPRLPRYHSQGDTVSFESASICCSRPSPKDTLWRGFPSLEAVEMGMEGEAGMNDGYTRVAWILVMRVSLARLIKIELGRHPIRCYRLQKQSLPSSRGTT
jgi:hypothetical protein